MTRMKENCCVIVVISIIALFGISLTPDPTPIPYPIVDTITTTTTTIPIEDDDMVKQLDIYDTTKNSSIEEIGHKSIVFDGTYYWIADYGTIDDMAIYRYDSDWNNETLVYSYNGLTSSEMPKGEATAMMIGTNLYFYYYIQFADGGVLKPRIYRVDYTAHTWTLTTYNPSANDVTPISGDAFWIGAEQYVALQCDSVDAGYTTRLVIYKLSDSSEDKDVAGQYSKGVVVDSIYYYLQYTGGIYNIQQFNGTAISLVTAVVLDGGSDLTQLWGQYFEIGDVHFVGWINNLWYYENSLSAWKKIDTVSSSTPVWLWYYDGATLKIRGFVYGNKYIHINSKFKIEIRSLTTTIIGGCGWDNYIIDVSGNIYIIDSTSVDFAKCANAISPYKPPSVIIRHTTEPTTNEFLTLYTDASVQFYEGFVESYESRSQGVYEYIMRSPAEQDLGKKITCTRPAEDSHVRLKYMLDTYADFLWYNAGIADVGLAAMDAHPYVNKSLLEIIKHIDQAENFQTQIRPTLEVYRGAYTDSGITLTEGTDCEILEFVKKPLKLSICKINGKLHGGVPYTGTAYGEANYGYYEDNMSHLGSDAECLAMATKIVANKNVVLTKIRVTVTGQGQFNYGTYVTFTSDTYGITADIYYILSTYYDAITDTCELILTSAIYIPSTKTQVVTGSEAAIQNQIADHEHQIDDLYQSVGQVSAAATPTTRTLTGAGAVAIAGDQAAHDLSADRTISLENDAGNNITAVETAAITNSATKVPNSALVYAVKTTADAAMPKAGGAFSGAVSMANNVYYQAKDSGGTALDMLGIDSSNRHWLDKYSNLRTAYGSNICYFYNEAGTSPSTYLFAFVTQGGSDYARIACKTPSANEDAATKLYVDGTVVAATFTSGATVWANYGGGYSEAGYWKIGNTVFLKGMVNRTSGTGTTIFVLPAGFRPSKISLFGTISNSAIGRVDVDTSGNVIFQLGTADQWTSLDGMFFRVA